MKGGEYIADHNHLGDFCRSRYNHTLHLQMAEQNLIDSTA